MTYIQERGSTHVYHVNRMSKEEMDHMISLCVHDQPAYCVAACPFKVDTKEMLFYASKGNFKKALAIYEKITPFPMILCDGCTAPCEDKCKLCELGDGISIREVERAIVRYGESSKRSSVFRMRKKKKAAIFGSGLFVLFLAGELERKMYPATVYCQEEDYEEYIACSLSMISVSAASSGASIGGSSRYRDHAERTGGNRKRTDAVSDGCRFCRKESCPDSGSSCTESFTTRQQRQ